MSVVKKENNSVTLSNGSVIELPFEVDEDITIEELNEILKEYLEKLNLLDDE